MSQSISIIVPVFNEPENIEETLERIESCINLDKEILVIYDRDSDTTLPILNRIINNFNNLKIIKNNIHPGPSGALITGFNYATKQVTLVTMADLCDDLSEVEDVINKYANNFDVISFSRFVKGGNAVLKKPEKRFNKAYFKHYLKVILPRIASFFLYNFGGLTISDPTNSYKLYSTKMLKSMNLKSKVSFSVTLEIVMKAKAIGCSFYEIPTKWTDRQFGKTNFPLVKSLSSYLPWFSILLINNRILSFPKSFFKKKFLKNE